MEDIRCPECGYRLKTNQCPICLKKVPFAGVKKQETQPRQVLPEKPRKQFHVPIDMEKMKRAAKAKKKPKATAVIGIAIALISIISSIMESCDGSSSYTPEYDYDAYVAAGVGEATDVPEIAQQYIYENNGLTICVDGMGLYYGDYTIPVTVTNDSKQDVTIHSRELSVNGFMMPGISLYCDVESGEEAQSFLILNDYDLEGAGISEIATVEFWLDIYDSEEYTDIDQTTLITLQTATAHKIEQPIDDAGTEVYADEGVQMMVRQLDWSDYGSCSLEVFVRNDSDMTVMLSDVESTLNGQESETLLWMTLRPGTCAVDRIYIDGLEEMGIDEPSQLETLVMEMEARFEEKQLPRDMVKTVRETVTIDLTEFLG